MASDRIGRKAAELVGVPPFEVRKVTTDFMLSQPQVAENIMQVPLNEKLMNSVKQNGIVNPHLCMKMWYPLAGSQRIRAVAEIKKDFPDFNLDITVHRFLEDYHNCFYLWPDKEFRSNAIAIWFQMQEVVFKSLYYDNEIDKDGTKMTEYEDIGEQLKWNRDDKYRTSDNNSSSSHIDSNNNDV